MRSRAVSVSTAPVAEFFFPGNSLAISVCKPLRASLLVLLLALMSTGCYGDVDDLVWVRAVACRPADGIVPPNAPIFCGWQLCCPDGYECCDARGSSINAMLCRPLQDPENMGRTVPGCFAGTRVSGTGR